MTEEQWVAYVADLCKEHKEEIDALKRSREGWQFGTFLFGIPLLFIIQALVLDLVIGGMSQADIAGILKQEAPNFG